MNSFNGFPPILFVNLTNSSKSRNSKPLYKLNFTLKFRYNIERKYTPNRDYTMSTNLEKKV